MIGITQRVEFFYEGKEKRDSLDQKWTEFLNYCGFDFVIIPNNVEDVSGFLKKRRITGIF